MEKNSKIFVAGDRGMVGSALVRALKAKGYMNILTRSRENLDLLDQASVKKFLTAEKPKYIFLAAAKVGGIQANSLYGADFIYQNLQIACNVINGAHEAGLERLLFLGSSCIYPRDVPQPIKEEYLLASYLEKTNEPYAVAKIAGLKLCEAYNRQFGRQYVSVMPCNLYGPNDDYDLHNSHVLPALIRKAHTCLMNRDSKLEVWGSGRPLREFLYVDDLADACVFLMERKSVIDGVYNVGSGTDITIEGLANLVAKVVGFSGKIVFDPTKPDGTPRKIVDISRMRDMGWSPTVSLEDGIRRAYRSYLAEVG